MTKISKVTACFISSYHMPEYPRITTLKEALLRASNLDIHFAQNTTRTILRYAQTLIKTMLIKIRYNPDVYIIVFRGHELYWPIKLIAGNKTVVFDEFVSPFDSLVNERKSIKPSSLPAKLLFKIEKSMLSSTSKVITDTEMNAVYYSKLFSLSPAKFYPIYLGADKSFFPRHNMEKSTHLNVLFYSTMLPLHGINVILQAARLCQDDQITFTIIGKFSAKRHKEIYKKLIRKRLKNIKHIEWVDYKKLHRYIQSSDICLGGPFGNTKQAQRIITGKTFQFLKMGRPVIMGKNKETQKFFKHGKSAFLVKQGNAKSLSETIKFCHKNTQLLTRVGSEGKKVYDKHFSLENRISKIQEVILA